MSKKIRDMVFNFTRQFLLQKKGHIKARDPIIAKFADELRTYPELNKYQWDENTEIHYNDRIEEVTLNLLAHYLEKFLAKIHSYIKKHEENPLNTAEFEAFFDEKYILLENSIFYSEYFVYEICVPLFGVKFPSNVKFVELSPNYIIRDISLEEYPYGRGTASDFKNIPDIWKGLRYDNPPNASFEITVKILKRLKNEPLYSQEDFVPFFLHKWEGQYNRFNDIVLSLFDFFYIYSEERFNEVPPLTLGDRYFVKLPPYSASYEYSPEFLIDRFPPPRNSLDLSIPSWKSLWKENYQNFYKKYYTDPQEKQYQIFRYILEIHRQIGLISNIPVCCFLLLSSLESLYYSKKHRNFLKKLCIIKKDDNSHKTTVARTFEKFCEKHGRIWPIFNFHPEKHIDDLYNFLITCFDYRNTIAHPANDKKLEDLKPIYLFKSKYSGVARLKTLILEHVKDFQFYSLKMWLEMDIQDTDQWFTYLRTLFE